MKISVIGTGYVGLVAGTCLADIGNEVTCIDIDKQKISQLSQRKITIYEPGLESIFLRNIEEGRLFFTNDFEAGIKEATVIFLALPTPPGKDGAADLQYVLGVADTIAPLLEHYTVIVDKSTVPVGTAEKVRVRLAQGTKVPFDVVSNPEFLREGVAVNDFLMPDRIVIGSSSTSAINIMKELYKPISDNGYPLLVMDEKSAELTKYAANAFLATKISFMNEIANICERLDTDVDAVRSGIGTDSRIGNQFLYAGIGYGGSCFPKDVKALVKASEDVSYDFKLLKTVEQINNAQKLRLVDKIKTHFNGSLPGRTIAMWGLSFKPETDDIREAPAIYMIRAMLQDGIRIKAYDPVAMDNIRQLFKKEVAEHKLTLCQGKYEAVHQADALAIVTEWDDFKDIDLALLKMTLKHPVVFDGRNVLNPVKMEYEGFLYYGIGRKLAGEAMEKNINNVLKLIPISE